MIKDIEKISIPTAVVGPIKITGNYDEQVSVPLSTYEKPLWASVNRGAKLSRESGGISVTCVDDKMTRSIILEGKDANHLLKIKTQLLKNKDKLHEIVASTSNYAKLINIYFHILGNLLYIRFEYTTGEASGHNMVTKASEALINYILSTYKNLEYVSISGNICTDKKVSSINGILGRGKNIIAEINITKDLCKKILKTTPEKIHNLNIKKNLIGSILAGSIRSANAHYANVLLAMYLPLGQDAANIIEGSQGITYTSINEDKSLYFSVNCPNIIVGAVGNGKNYDFAIKYLDMLTCGDHYKINSSQKIASIITATILCSEISLMASQTNRGELMRAHELIERRSLK